MLDNLSFTNFHHSLQGMERIKNHLGAYESGLSESGGVPGTLWFAQSPQEVSLRDSVSSTPLTGWLREGTPVQLIGRQILLRKD